MSTAAQTPPSSSPSTVPYCDWFVQVNGCPNEDLFWGFKLAETVSSAVACLLVCAYVALRAGQRGKGRWLNVGVVDNTALLFVAHFALQAVMAGLVTFDKITSYPAAYLFEFLHYIILLVSVLYFLYGIAHSIPNAYMDTKGGIRRTLLPPRWIFLSFIMFEAALLVVCVFLALNIGLVRDRDGFGAIAAAYQIMLGVFAVILVLFTAAFIFYCDRLIKVIRENYANSGNAQSGTMLRAIRRMRLLVYLFTPFAILFMLMVVFLAAFYVDIFNNLVASLVIMFLETLAIPGTSFLIVPMLFLIEIYGTLNLSERSGSSGTAGAAAKKRTNPTTGNGGAGSSRQNNLRGTSEPSLVLRDALTSLMEAANVPSGEIDEKHQPLSLSVLSL